MKELERKRLFKQAHKLLDRADGILREIYEGCLKKTQKQEEKRKEAA